MPPSLRAEQSLQKPLRPGHVRPSQVTVEQGKQSVRHNVQSVSAPGGKTFVQEGVAQKRGAGGGLQTKQHPPLLLGARNVQGSIRHGLSPEEQYKQRSPEKGGIVQVGVTQTDGVIVSCSVREAGATNTSLQGMDSEESRGGLQKEQYPPLPRSARRPQSSGHGILPLSHDMQKGPRPIAGTSGHKGAAQRLFLEGSYKQPWRPSSLRHEY